MAKFNTRAARPAARGPVTTTGITATYEGGAAYTRDVKSDLVLLAVTNMVGEDTFYESAGGRDNRFAALVRAVAVADPGWTAAFVAWLRTGAGMRSASLVAAAAAVDARLTAGLHGENRQIVDAALHRPDEPGEFLAYWTARHGRRIPKPVKRGLADAVQRLYSERALLKYDTGSKGYRFADVIDLVHPAPADGKPWQGDLFRHALDRRHNRDTELPAGLRTIAANTALRADAAADPSVLLDADRLRAAGMTWEDVLSLAGSALPKARLWESVAPSMGVMALIRNLRNFDEAGVSDEAAEAIARRIGDPATIAESRLFPYRFLSAYRAAPSLRWGHALDKALAASCVNVPALPGRTLVLVDTSGSMQSCVSAKSVVRHVDIAALFAIVLAHRGAAVDLVGYANGYFHHPLTPGGSVLRAIDAFDRRIGEVGHGTETVAALKATYRGHDRVVLISDMQAFHYPGAVGSGDRGRGVSVSEAVPAGVPMFGINTSGYAATGIDSSRPNRYEIGGFSDKLFTMMDLLGRGREAGWPWESARTA
jgi:hypothetical protein